MMYIKTNANILHWQSVQVLLHRHQVTLETFQDVNEWLEISRCQSLSTPWCYNIKNGIFSDVFMFNWCTQRYSGDWCFSLENRKKHDLSYKHLFSINKNIKKLTLPYTPTLTPVNHFDRGVPITGQCHTFSWMIVGTGIQTLYPPNLIWCTPLYS